MKTRILSFSTLTLTLMVLAYPASACSDPGLAYQRPVTGPHNLSSFSGRGFPDTTRGVHVFSDQLAADMSDQQLRFAATHYAGTQKMTRASADRLRAINPSFLILHYRLGMALGYRTPGSACQPTGDWLRIIEDNNWVREYPDAVQDNWFYHYPEGSTSRVYNCDWGWYLMNLDDTTWRNYWQGEVLRQVQANDNDGVFTDSLSVPNYLGYDNYQPNLPAVNEPFENAWSNRISSWLSWLQTQQVGDYYIIPNVGSWINSRDRTNYGPADGVMVEGFAMEADQSPYAYSDWQLQMNRILGLVQDKAVIAQSYVGGDQERMFVLATHLLVKSSHTYLNIAQGTGPEWYPEYDIAIGAPTQNAGSDIDNLYDPSSKVYRRAFDNGLVLVNAQDWSGTTVTVNLDGTYYLAQTRGGGPVPISGIPTGEITYQPVTRVTLPPYSGAILLNRIPSMTSSTTTSATSTVTSVSYLSMTTTKTATSYSSTSTLTRTVPTVTTVALVPLTVTSKVHSIQYVTPIATTTVTSYTGTLTWTSTIVVPATVTVGPWTMTSTVQTTRALTSTGTTRETSCTTMTSTDYTATSVSTSTWVVYTTVTSLAGSAASNPFAYLGLISLLAVTVSHRTTAGKTWRTRHAASRHAPSTTSSPHPLSPHFTDQRDTLLSRPMSLMERRCSSN